MPYSDSVPDSVPDSMSSFMSDPMSNSIPNPVPSPMLNPLPNSVPDPRLDPMPDSMRLQQYLARAGVASRRASEGIIAAGRVTVNNQLVTELGTKVIPCQDRIAVDGVEVFLPEKQTTLMLNKPAGYVTTMTDPYKRPCVAELVPVQDYPGLFPVGRLDFDTSGLLLFTTDGNLGNTLMHPRHQINKTYRALVLGQVSQETCRALQSGVMLEDGLTAPAHVCIRERTDHTTLLELTIHEGKNRQVRRMCEAVGHPVQELSRIAYGSLTLDGMISGSYRLLSAEEVDDLLSSAMSQ